MYEWWIYSNIFNTKWFVLGIVIAVFGFNALSHIILWRIVGGKTDESEEK